MVRELLIYYDCKYPPIKRPDKTEVYTLLKSVITLFTENIIVKNVSTNA